MKSLLIAYRHKRYELNFDYSVIHRCTHSHVKSKLDAVHFYRGNCWLIIVLCLVHCCTTLVSTKEKLFILMNLCSAFARFSIFSSKERRVSIASAWWMEIIWMKWKIFDQMRGTKTKVDWNFFTMKNLTYLSTSEDCASVYFVSPLSIRMDWK